MYEYKAVVPIGVHCGPVTRDKQIVCWEDASEWPEFSAKHIFSVCYRPDKEAIHVCDVYTEEQAQKLVSLLNALQYGMTEKVVHFNKWLFDNNLVPNSSFLWFNHTLNREEVCFHELKDLFEVFDTNNPGIKEETPIGLLNKKENQFPNGFASWMETHHEIVGAIAIDQNNVNIHIPKSPIVADRYESEGTEGIYKLAEELTNKFELLHKGEILADYFETIESFIQTELY